MYVEDGDSSFLHRRSDSKLELFCGPETPVRRLLDIWPPFPLVVSFGHLNLKKQRPSENDNLIAALEHRDRVCKITIDDPPGSLWDQIVTVMKEPFPELRFLWFLSMGKALPLQV
jgi:hypothetical protein